MDKLKLTYFDFPGGRAEPARLALHLGGIAFDIAHSGVQLRQRQTKSVGHLGSSQKTRPRCRRKDWQGKAEGAAEPPKDIARSTPLVYVPPRTKGMDSER